MMRILLIDDNAKDAKTLKDLLAASGEIDCVTENSLEKAMARLDEPFDLILLDLTLPGGTPVDFLGRISDRVPEMPIIALDEQDNQALALEAAREGAQDYLVKPELDGTGFIRRIHMALERSRFQKKLVRLASFAWQNPNAIIETDAEGEIIYLNPAGSKQFPALYETGSHPFLSGLSRIVKSLQEENRNLMVREIVIGEKCYEQHVFYVPGSGVVRSYIADVTEKRKAEDKLKARTREVERMNRLMVGRELKMKELKLKIALLTAQMKNAGETRTVSRE